MKLPYAGLALAVLATVALAAPQSASAAHARHMMAKRMRLVPSQPKPGYHSMVGTPSLVDVVPVSAQGGLLGLGVLPSTGLFKSVPLLGNFGL